MDWGNLTRLSAYWLQLGIELERIRPAHPEDNDAATSMTQAVCGSPSQPVKPVGAVVCFASHELP